MFLSWQPNGSTSIKELHLKGITLLALTLKTSDIAPKSKRYNSISGQLEPHLSSTLQITFHVRGSASITFRGIKNDASKSGFDVHLHCDANNLLDPVSALQTYISRTVTQRPNPVASFFITLQPPFRALRISTMAKVMEEAIRSVGLGNQGLSVKDFRHTGATAAIDSGLHPDIVMKTGRLKKARHFCYHYVHSKPLEEYTHDYLFHE